MDSILPTITTGSVFVAVILLDFVRQTYDFLPVHIVLGGLSTVVMFYIANNVGVGVAWTLLLIPFLFVFIGLLIEMTHSTKKASADSPYISTYVASSVPSIPSAILSSNLMPIGAPVNACGSSSSGCLNPASVKSA